MRAQERRDGPSTRPERIHHRVIAPTLRVGPVSAGGPEGGAGTR